jgi:hypothetical protein
MGKGTVKWFNNQKGFGFIHSCTSAQLSAPDSCYVAITGMIKRVHSGVPRARRYLRRATIAESQVGVSSAIPHVSPRRC